MAEKLLKKDLQEIQKKLELEKASLEKELDNIATKNPKNPEDYNAKWEEYGSDVSEAIPPESSISISKEIVAPAVVAVEDGPASDSVKSPCSPTIRM